MNRVLSVATSVLLLLLLVACGRGNNDVSFFSTLLGGRSREFAPPTEEEILWDSVNRNEPSDILPIITFFGGGGGGYSECDTLGVSAEVPSGPSLVPVGNRVELGRDHIYRTTCGWQAEETVKLKVIRPDGSVAVQTKVRAVLEQGEHTTYWVVHLDYKLPLVAPVGAYEVIFEGEFRRLQDQVEAYLPEEPRLYSFEEGKRWLLYQFAPREHVRVFAYEESGHIEWKLVGWKAVYVGSDGALTIHLEDSRNIYLTAVGDLSGEVRSPDGRPFKSILRD